MRFCTALFMVFFVCPVALQAAEVTVFKWQDDQGRWHYGEKPPKAAHEELNIDTEANVTAGDPFDSSPHLPPSTSQSAPDSSDGGLRLPYTPGRIRKMLDDIKNIDKAVKQRNKTLDRL